MFVKMLINRGFAVGVAVMSCCGGFALAQGAPAAAQQIPVVAFCGDVSGFIANAGSLAEKVQPGMNGDMIKTQIGAMVQDPGLSGMPAGAGAAAVIGSDGVIVMLEVAAAKADAYENAAKMFQLQTAQAGGFVVIAQNPAQLEKGKALAPSIKAGYLSGKREPTVVVAVPVASLMTQYGAMLDMMFATGSANTEIQQQMGTVVEEVKATLSNVATASFTIIPSASGVRVDARLQPVKPAAPPAAPPLSVDQLASLVSTSKAMRLVSQKTPKNSGFSPAAGTEASKKIAADMEAALNGGMAMGIDVSDTGEMKIFTAVAAKDAAAAANAYGMMTNHLQQSGSLDKSAAGTAGITAEFKKDVRESGGTKVSAIVTTFDTSKMDPTMQKIYEKQGKTQTTEFAVSGNMLLNSTSPAQMDAAIAAAKSLTAAPGVLASQKVFGADGFAYIDYDIGESMRTFMSFVPDVGETPVGGMMKQFSDSLANVPPITVAGFEEAKLTRFSVNFPVEIFTAYGKIFAAYGKK